MGNTKLTWAVSALLLQAVTTAQIMPFLTGGTAAGLGQFPAHVGINISPTVFCGGTILNNNHILTSGSCVLDSGNNLTAASQLNVRSGVVTIDASTPAVLVDRIFVHPHYNPFTFENDIAIVRTTTPFTFPATAEPNVAAAELNGRIAAEYSGCTVTGWNWQTGVATMALQWMAVTVAPRAECNNMFNGMVQQSMICARGATNNNAMCLANRGGGLYCDGRLTGIASFGFGCGQNASTTVFTQVRYFESWIQQQFTRTDIPPAGVTPMPGITGGAYSMFNLSMAAILFATLIITILR
ncbi:trypsin-like [Armigeres subalbatus]|uniref:trypsin-like n=1 Tax=Armigeres subalbatus TaxID=124917 RepID=UPI002ED4DE3C